MTLLSLSGVTIRYGVDPLLTDVTFTVAAGERWGIVGRNGTGKTSLFRLITGAAPPYAGAVARQPGLKVSLLEQHRDFGTARTVWEVAAGAFADLLALEVSLAEQATAMAAAGEQVTGAQLDRYARDLERFERDGGYEIAPKVDAILMGLGFDPQDARTREVATLSGGERGRLGLARQLAQPSDILMLDEPTNHLDLETTHWLEGWLRQTDRTVMVVSHDRAFLAAFADHVLHVEHRTAVPYASGYEAFVAQRAERRLSAQRSYEKQRKSISAEEDYIRRNIAGQNSAQAKGRRKRLERLPRLSPPPGEGGAMSVRFEVRERGGDQVLVAEKARIAVEGRTLIDDLTLRLMRGERVGLVGPNGAGKSTLLKTILGEREPAAGALRVGGSISVAYYRQDLTQLPQQKSLYEIINDIRPLWGRAEIQGHLGRFGFSGDEVQRRTETLSGGERARVALAMLMLSGANLLILDEPTNHLDVESIEALEDALERYEGTVLLVSHDRALLRALATRVWVLHDQRIVEFPGPFAEWEVASAEREHAADVEAQEAEALARVKEKQRTERKATQTEEQRVALRRARRAAEAAEQEIARREAEVARLVDALEEPSLYLPGDDGTRAAELSAALDAERAALDAVLTRWAEATEEMERLTAEEVGR